jgi:hypothetical protein
MSKGGIMKNFRHGDLALIGIEKLPEGLKASDSRVIMKGSGGNDHSFQKGVFYPKAKGQVIGYLEAKAGCTLFHMDHGKKVTGQTLRKVSLPIGFYELRCQIEDTHQGMKRVID